ncbi:MAG: UDP-N-acetylmuramate dehydrogenase [Pseudomonadota bacterium]
MTLTGKQQEKLQEIAQDCVLFEERLAKYSTIQIGGLVDALVTPANLDMLKQVLNWAKQERIPYLFLGAASNTLIRDGGFRGIILRLKKGFDQIEVINQAGEDVFISVGAGLFTATLVQFAAENGFAGLEFLAGIPGCVGGNVLTNAGTNESCVADVLDEISVVDRSEKEMSLKRKALDFSYRNLKLARSTAVIKAVFRLKKTDPEQVRHAVEKLIEKRKQSQPWGKLSLGCVFKNPIAGKGKKNLSAAS